MRTALVHVVRMLAFVVLVAVILMRGARVVGAMLTSLLMGVMLLMLIVTRMLMLMLMLTAGKVVTRPCA